MKPRNGGKAAQAGLKKEACGAVKPHSVFLRKRVLKQEPAGFAATEFAPEGVKSVPEGAKCGATKPVVCRSREPT